MWNLKVLKHLTVKRPVEASRMDFFAHAEAFAALVNLDFVSINGMLMVCSLCHLLSSFICLLSYSFVIVHVLIMEVAYLQELHSLYCRGYHHNHYFVKKTRDTLRCGYYAWKDCWIVSTAGTTSQVRILCESISLSSHLHNVHWHCQEDNNLS